MTYSDEDLYGEDLIRDVKRWSREENQGMVSRVQELERQAAQDRVQLARERCMHTLDAAPDLKDRWRQINTDPAFLKWLCEIHELIGRPRMEALQQAYDTGATDRVLAIFRAYLASLIPARERTNERLPFESSAKQPAVRPSADGYAAKRRVFKPGEIAKFYDDCRRGRYDGREAERNQIEAEILAAANQGRVAAAAQQPRMPGRRPWE